MRVYIETTIFKYDYLALLSQNDKQFTSFLMEMYFYFNYISVYMSVPNPQSFPSTTLPN